ncbi:MFS transporter [Flexivirga caeni]|uniref:MFS transporter n=1 Tax=Flexivirga caeni TaxID=2294115 RepID=UPI0013158DDC|nr:MFS transporter [Flexivirga caeni]
MTIPTKLRLTASASGASTSPAPSPIRTRLVLPAVLVTQLMLVLDAAIVNIALPDIGTQLHMNSTSLSWVVNAYTLTFGGLLLLGARAGDLLGRRTTFLAGMAVFVAASMAGGLSQGEGLLLASRALQGAGAAFAAPSALAILMSLYKPGAEQTRAVGWYTVVSASGAATGLLAGGILTSVASWRWVFFVNVPIGLAVLVAGYRALSRDKGVHGSVDVAGALLVTVGMSSVVYGFIRAASDGWLESGTLAAFGVGLSLLVAFLVVELRATSPVMPLRLFADRDRATAYVARLLLVAGSLGSFFFMSQYMQIVLGWTPWQSGLAFLPFPVTIFISSQVVARVVSRHFSTRTIAVVGTGLSTVGMLLLTTLTAHTTYLQILPAFLVFALGNGIAFVPLTTAGLARVDKADTSVASGLVNVTQQLGGALGLAVLVTVFATAGKHPAAAHGAGAHSVDVFVTGADRGFQVGALLLLVAFAMVLLVMRRSPGGAQQRRAADPVEQLRDTEEIALEVG